MRLGVPIRTNWLTERSSNQPTDLLALLRRHERRVKALGHDHCVGEFVDRGRWVLDDPLLVLGTQAVAEPHAEIVQKPGHVHCEER